MRRLNAAASITAIAIWAFATCAASAQSLDTLVDRGLYNGQLRIQQNRITFCLEKSSPMRDLDKAIATQIAASQLMHVDFYDVELDTATNQDDLERLLFVALVDDCDALMSANLEWGPLPNWLTISQSYYTAPYVLAVLDGKYSKLADIPPGSKIGSTLFSDIDENFVLLQQTLPADKRWVRIPYDDVPTMLGALRSKAIEGALIFAPLLGKLGATPATQGITIASTAPVRADPEQLGVLFLSRNTFIRTAVDQAISAMQKDGTIGKLAAEQGYPAQAAQ